MVKGRRFAVGDVALRVSQTIVEHHPEIALVRLESWTVGSEYGTNFRTADERRSHLAEALRTNGYPIERDYPRAEFLALEQQDLTVTQPNQVWGISSKVICVDGSAKHIPMMDVDPDKITLNDVIERVKAISEGNPGVLVGSGRGIHYYGDYLVNDGREWEKLLAKFLKATGIVDMADGLQTARFIGHCLDRGFTTLRLTGGTSMKKEVPKVIELLNQE
ncbi:MAG TPA: hypothetical protein VL944_01025 [Candidatus Acidoferrum sp.]|nr:hypothetical protein [Candidatus Acidoferrum sp.]